MANASRSLPRQNSCASQSPSFVDRDRLRAWPHSISPRRRRKHCRYTRGTPQWCRAQSNRPRLRYRHRSKLKLADQERPRCRGTWDYRTDGMFDYALAYSARRTFNLDIYRCASEADSRRQSFPPRREAWVWKSFHPRIMGNGNVRRIFGYC